MDWDFGDVFLAMITFYFWFLFIWMFVGVFADIFRRRDLSGVAKAGWLMLVVLLPFLGILIYMLTRPPPTAEEIEAMTPPSGKSTADELATLAELKEKGSITAEEFDKLKAKAIA